MNPLSALYGAIVSTRNGLYDRGTLPARRLRGPVISIGNLTVGGSGKTPFLIALGELLKQRGIPFDVLSRGYRRTTRGVVIVDPAGSARDFGDEPLLLARKLNVPVIVGEDRYAAGQIAEERFGPQLHLLDDGFQHRRLARDFDIVLVNETDVHDSLLPFGRMREPLASLARADAVVVTNQTGTSGLPLTTQQVWRVQRDIVAPLIDEPCVAFCGIARPKNFFRDLQTAGIRLTATRSFRDHHPYSQADIQRLLRLRASSGAIAFLTTEKDAVNLQPFWLALRPVYAVPSRMQIENADAALTAMLASVYQRKQQFP